MEKWEKQWEDLFGYLEKQKSESERRSDSLDKWEPQIKDFFKKTVNPVFEQIAIGFTALGRTVTRQNARYYGRLVGVAERITIELNGETEFCYEIGIESFQTTPRAKERGWGSASHWTWSTTFEDFRELTKSDLAEIVSLRYKESVTPELVEYTFGKKT